MKVVELQHKLYVVQKIIDSIIPTFCALSISLVAIRYVPPPESISTAFGSPLAAWLWSVMLFISCVAVVVGIWLRGKEGPNGLPSKSTYIYFEYPGLISAFFTVTSYSIALVIVLGISATAVAAGFTFSIGVYFLARWYKTRYTIQVAKANLRRNHRG